MQLLLWISHAWNFFISECADEIIKYLNLKCIKLVSGMNYEEDEDGFIDKASEFSIFLKLIDLARHIFWHR